MSGDNVDVLGPSDSSQSALDGESAGLDIPVDSGSVLVEPPPKPTPAGITLRRLDKRAYNRTVQDLFGTTLSPGDTFPTEFAPGLFSHVSKGQTISPYLLELYARSADAVSDDVLLVRPPGPLAWHFEAESLSIPHSFPVPGYGNALHDSKPVVVSFELPEASEVNVSVRVYGKSWKGSYPVIQMRMDGALVYQTKVSSETPVVLTTSQTLAKGTHTFAIQLYNPAYEEELFQSQGRLIYVDWMAVEAPDLPGNGSDPRSLLLTCDPDTQGAEECAREVLGNLLPRAWRRPVADEEIEPLVSFVLDAVEDGRGFDRGLKVALEAVLMHPSFLFLVEARGGLSTEEVTPITAYEIASRLSYFLWGTLPDSELFEAASNGSLMTPEGRVEQVQRLLASPRSSALTEGLVEHWFLVQKLRGYGLGWTDVWFDDLRESMVQEIRLSVAALITRNRPVRELLLSPTVFVDGTLGQHYGLNVSGRAFQEIASARTGRGGLLQMAGLLTVLSHPSRSSAVRRGKWVYEALLCGHVPPPPDAMEFSEETNMLALTGKDELNMHLTEPECVGCHQLMDPLGLPLEKFDELGQRRHLDEGIAIDPTGELPDGRIVKGASGLAEALSNDPRFIECMVRRFVTYALAREPLPYEKGAIEELAEAWGDKEYRLGDLIELIANHPLFLTRVPIELDDSEEVAP